ncbi:MAG: minor capsid protein [Bacteroidaceae bacterium]|nr:minor capsid protein [Bacteroidaceae bacterium]
MMKALFNEEGSQFRIDIITEKPAQDFINAHADALNSGFQQVHMSDAMRQRLQRSNYIFSGIKTFHELNEAFPSLIDENGNRKPFEQFLNDVQKIDATYNQNYLRAEYNFCHASATMVAKWEQFQQDGDRYNLQYRTAHDDRVRPEHAALDRVTLPITDPFWEEFYPPNGWNCRCTVVQVRKSKYPVTPHDQAMALGEEATGKDTKGIFHFNPGIEQKTFPDYNPYTIRRCRDCDIAKGNLTLAYIPDNEMCALCKMIRKCANANKGGGKILIPEDEYQRVLAKPLKNQFVEEHQGVKGKVLLHELACINAPDYNRVLSAAKAFADNIGDCRINPEIPKLFAEGRKKIFDKIPDDCHANPDLWVEGIGFVDVKSPKKVMNCCRNANHASKEQHACVCLTNHCFKNKAITEKQIEDRNMAIWNSKDYHHDYIFWLIDGKLRKYKRP